MDRVGSVLRDEQGPQGFEMREALVRPTNCRKHHAELVRGIAIQRVLRFRTGKEVAIRYSMA